MKAPLCDHDFSVMVPVFEPGQPESGQPETSQSAVATKTAPTKVATKIWCHRCVRPRCKRSYDCRHGYFNWSTPWPPRERPQFVCRVHGTVMTLTKADRTELRFQCPAPGCRER